MARHRSPRHDRLPSADDILAGRASPSASTLMRVIHAINPTGHDAAAREKARRYELKARLQSLLIRRHGEDIVVEAGGDEGVVSLRHRHLEVDACHAVLEELDEDARSWARYQLDVAESEVLYGRAAPAGAGAGAGTAASRDVESTGDEGTALSRARQAFEEYDYEAARELLVEAFRRRPEDGAVACALLELLVDTLADYAAALDLAGSLPPGVAALSTVRVLLALSAARTGDATRALTLIDGIGHERAADVLVVLADEALRGGDTTSAARHVDAIRERGPHPELLRLERDLAAEQARQREPAERELLAAAATGLDEAVAERARRLLESDPASAVARRILAEWAAVERARRAEGLRRDVEHALASAEISVARALVRSPLWASIPADIARPLEHELARLETAARNGAAEARVRAVCAALSTDLRRGLEAYAELTEPLRAEVRARNAEPTLGFIDAMPGVRLDVEVEAALALREAEAELDRAPSLALQALVPFAKELRSVKRAAEIRARATDILARTRRDKASTGLIEALLAADRGDVARATALLDALDVKGLQASDRAEVDSLRRQLARLDEIGRIVGEHEAARAEGNLVEARRLARLLVAATEGAERTRWQGVAEELSEEIARTWSLLRDDTPMPLSALRSFDWHRFEEEPPLWVRSDRPELILADARGSWVFVRSVDLEQRVVTQTVALRTPEPLGSLDVSVLGSTLWLCGQRGAVIELDLDTKDVLRWIPSSRIREEADVVEWAKVVPPGFVWASIRSRGYGERTRVFDLKQMRFVRDVAFCDHATMVAGLEEPRVLQMGERKPELCLPGGKRTSELRVTSGFASWTAGAVHPSGRGVVGLVTPYDSSGEMIGLMVYESGSEGGTTMIAESSCVRPSGMATSLGEGATLVHYYRRDATRRLFLMRLEGGRLSFARDIEAPDSLLLVQDESAKKIWGLWHADDAVHLHEVGGDTQELAPLGARVTLRVPVKEPMFSCTGLKGARMEMASTLAVGLEGVLDPVAHARTYLDAHAEEPETLIAFASALKLARQYDAGDEISQWIWFRHPQHPEVRLLRAEEHARRAEWREVRELVEVIEPEQLPVEYRGHVLHLLAMSLTVDGEVERAREVLERAFGYEHADCELEQLSELVAAASAPLAGSSTEVTGSVAGRATWAIRTADAKLAAGDPRGALAALDHIEVLRLGEIQTQARRAEACLAFETPALADRIQKIHVLGAFCDAYERRKTYERELIVPIGAYSPERLDELMERAGAWLSAVSLGLDEKRPRTGC